MNTDLFGESDSKLSLRDKYIVPPFSVIDTMDRRMKSLSNFYKRMGILSEIGRDATPYNYSGNKDFKEYNEDKGYSESANNFFKKLNPGVSIFNPAICHLMYHWFAPQGGSIIDPFAGGSVRGIVANYNGYNYTGIDIRQEQVNSNRDQAINILEVNNQPQWICGDSLVVTKELIQEYDMMFTCPPYGDLEVYSDIQGDISNKSCNDFNIAYKSIIHNTCKLLKPKSYAVVVVGEYRINDNEYACLIPNTIQYMRDCGMIYYNEIIMLTSLGNAGIRADKYFKKNRKVVKVHQNILVFKKP